MRVDLVAVQAELVPEHYRSRSAFFGRVQALAAEAVSGLEAGVPRVVAFPEAFAMPLLFWLNTPGEALEQPTTLAAAAYLARRSWGDLLRTAWRAHYISPAVFYHLRAKMIWQVYEAAFAKAAKTTGAYLVAGSLFSPLMDHEPARGLFASSKAVYNLGLVFSPQGRILARVPKLELTPSERSAFLSPGTFGTQIVETHLGPLAILICLDAFHDGWIERADAAGAWLLVQPSANARLWEGPWSADSSQREGEVWLREGLAGKLCRREQLRFGMNPMLNGRFYQLRFEGKSSISTAGHLLTIADRATGDAIVRHQVVLDPTPQAGGA